MTMNNYISKIKYTYKVDSDYTKIPLYCTINIFLNLEAG